MITKEDLRNLHPVLRDCPLAFDDGWNNLMHLVACAIEDYFNDNPAYLEHFKIADAKEKYARLSLYFYGIPEGLDDILFVFERCSVFICEACGNPGTVRYYRGWYKTLCEKHFEEWKER